MSQTKEAQKAQERSTEQIAQLREDLAKVRQQMADKNDAFDKLSESVSAVLFAGQGFNFFLIKKTIELNPCD